MSETRQCTCCGNYELKLEGDKYRCIHCNSEYPAPELDSVMAKLKRRLTSSPLFREFAWERSQ